MSVVLTSDLLDEWRQRWRAAGCPLGERLQPGRSVTDIRDVLAGANLEAPEEVLTWWAWQDGITTSLGPGTSPGPDLEFLSLPQALDSRSVNEEVARSLAVDIGPLPRDYWNPGWLPLLGHSDGSAIVGDCSRGDERVPVRYHTFEDYHPAEVVVLDSLGDLVTLWIRFIDQGLWWYDDASGYWEHRWDMIPEELRRSRLA